MTLDELLHKYRVATEAICALGIKSEAQILKLLDMELEEAKKKFL